MIMADYTDMEPAVKSASKLAEGSVATAEWRESRDARLREAHERGAATSTLADWSGLSPTRVHRILVAGQVQAGGSVATATKTGTKIVKRAVDLGPSPLARGERVIVTEQGIAPWIGTVRAVKPSSVSGWWAEIDRDDRSGTWSIRLDTTGIEKIDSPEDPRDEPDAHLDAEFEGRFEIGD